ncbi:MAG: hypothetical protein NXH71_03765 [Erythrobacteraceae bacterium]|jgi:hypothetical protein|nr:hypothetical protein [Erythrobacteraceae bacterium]
MSFTPKLLLAGAAGYLGYHFLTRNKSSSNAAFAPDQPHESHTDVRDAGPRAMRDQPKREWTEVDEDSDQSFPASDPPGGY